MKSMRRAVRSARAVSHGQEILELVRSKECRRLIFEAAKAGVPPVTALSTIIIGEIGEKDENLSRLNSLSASACAPFWRKRGLKLHRRASG